MNGKVILSGTVGSQAYGLATATSDVDKKGIYVAAIRDVLGLNTISKLDHTETSHNPDREYHEVYKYLTLALKCNPTILEMVYLDDYDILTDEGRLIVNYRMDFLYEKGIRGSYGAYAKQQADRLMRRNEEGKEGFSSDVKSRTEKHGRHCMRLLLQGAQLLSEGQLTVNVSDKRDFLFSAGELAASDPAAFYKMYEEQAAKFDKIETKLPDKPNRFAIDLVLQDIRKKSLKDSGWL